MANEKKIVLGLGAVLIILIYLLSNAYLNYTIESKEKQFLLMLQSETSKNEKLVQQSFQLQLLKKDLETRIEETKQKKAQPQTVQTQAKQAVQQNDLTIQQNQLAVQQTPAPQIQVIKKKTPQRTRAS